MPFTRKKHVSSPDKKFLKISPEYQYGQCSYAARRKLSEIFKFIMQI